MLASLRARLWLSYALLIITILLVVGGGFLLVLSRSSLAARQAAPRLRGAEGAAYALLEIRVGQTPGRDQEILQRISQLYAVHLAILNQDGTIVSEAGLLNNSPFPKISLPLSPDTTNLTALLAARDSNKRIWFYTLRVLDNQAHTYLMVSMLIPQIRWLTLLTSDIGVPLFEAAGISLVISVILALLLGGWIGNPLRHITLAAKKIATGDNHPIDLSGPTEVKELASSFNEMSLKVKASQQSQRDFLANVSHELKTPLTAIQGFAQAIVDGAASSPDILRQAGEVILTESDRMYRLIMDLLVLARLDAGTANLVSEPVDLVGILENVLQKFEPIARKNQLTVESRIDPLPPFSGDGDRLSQVFSNLIDNAIKFTSANGRIMVSAGMLDNLIKIKVKDSGIGIAPGDLKRIFERFYQADKSRRGGTGRGVGLGLAIAYQIITAEGGSISVTSTVGEGSEFSIELPVGKTKS